MLWLEMSRDVIHGGEDWGFTRSLWSPTKKNALASQQSSSTWPFWEAVLQVKADDVVLHLRGEGQSAAFIGLSNAEEDGYETAMRPPFPGQWDYAETFYRVPLKNFTPFESPILLRDIFKQRNTELREYFTANKQAPSAQKRRLFYVIQSDKLQCLNGAYLSEVDDRLAEILLAPSNQTPRDDVFNDETWRALSIRKGQTEFARKVRANYQGRCCIPSCPINERLFLIAGHIVRYADSRALSEEISNGICLCRMHDVAFEEGLFTLTDDFRIAVNLDRTKNSTWAQEHLVPFEGESILLGEVLPSVNALKEHWKRIGFTPNQRRRARR